MTASGLVCMGRFSGAFGLKGEIRVFPFTEDPETLLNAGEVLIGADPQSARTYEVESIRTHGQWLLFSLAGVDDREKADKLKGAWVYLPAGILPPPDEDEYYWHQAIGARVLLENGEEVGRIKDISNAGAHDLWLIADPDGKEALVPVTSEVVLEIALDRGEAVIRPLEGLFEAQGFWPDPDGGEDMEA